MYLFVWMSTKRDREGGSKEGPPLEYKSLHTITASGTVHEIKMNFNFEGHLIVPINLCNHPRSHSHRQQARAYEAKQT